MFHIQLTAFAVLAIFAGTALADWGVVGQEEWQSRCGPDATYHAQTDQYICFVCNGDITQPPTDGNFKGYARDGGRGFVLVRGETQETHLENPDRTIDIYWDVDVNVAHLVVNKWEGSWVPIVDKRINLPDYKAIPI